MLATVVKGVAPVNEALSVAAPTGKPGMPELQLPAVPQEVLIVPVHVESKAKVWDEIKKQNSVVIIVLSATLLPIFKAIIKSFYYLQVNPTAIF